MRIIYHRVNTIAGLVDTPKEFGVEIDVRGKGEKMFLSHDPLKDEENYDELEDYLKKFQHDFIIFNMKEAGYEQRVMDLAKKYDVKNYFLLDVEFPYLYHATRNQGVRNIAVRFSEAEPIGGVEAQIDEQGKPFLDWVWIDVNTKLPLDGQVIPTLNKFKTCLVCPERWGRPEDIIPYAKRIRELGLRLDAVMTSPKYAPIYKKYFPESR